MELNKEHIGIMEHTLSNRVFCGESKEMDELCQAGYMKCLGNKPFVTDKYYCLTRSGSEILDGLWQDKINN